MTRTTTTFVRRHGEGVDHYSWAGSEAGRSLCGVKLGSMPPRHPSRFRARTGVRALGRRNEALQKLHEDSEAVRRGRRIRRTRRA